MKLYTALAAVFVMIFSTNVHAVEYIPISKKVYSNSTLPFDSHRGNAPFETALAMNIQYGPIKLIRDALSHSLKYQLNFFTGWNKAGEAHVTVITPPEFDTIIGKFVSIDRIEQIALSNDIQSSDFTIQGIGRGQIKVNGKPEETYFIILHSENLLNIRRQVYQEYLNNGGPVEGWNPDHFYPHITVGYSLRDLHEADGVIKDAAHSLDDRFKLVFTD